MKKSERKLILSVGSSQILSSAANFFPGRKADVISKFQSENILLPETALHPLWRKVSVLIARTLDNYKNVASKCDEAVVIFSSPWYFSDVRQVEKKFDPAVILSRNMAEEIVSLETDNFKKDVVSKYHLSQNDIASARLAINSLKLNGYSIENLSARLEGKRIREFYASVYASILFGEAVSYIEKELRERSFCAVKFISSPEVFLSISQKFGYGDVTIIDIGGEITDIVLIEGGRISKIASFGQGFNSFIRRIAAILSLDLEQSQSLLEAFLENKLEEKTKIMIAEGLRSAIEEWHNIFMGILERQIAPMRLPGKIFLAGSKGAGNFKVILSSPTLARFTRLGTPFSVELHPNLMDLYLTYFDGAE